MSLVAIDIGGSGSRIRVGGPEPVEATGPALAVRSGRPDYGHVLESLAASIPAGRATEVVAIGATGLLSLADPQEVARAAGALWPTARIVVVPDVVAGLVGAWGLEGGAIVAAGTGAIGLATDARETWLRSDGWGHLLGDAGSGAWIGARGLEAALRRRDRRAGGSEALLTAARDLLGDPEGLPALVRSAPNEATFLASFVPPVVAAATAGDDVAVRILDEAGWRLAETATSLLVDGIPARVALVGGITAIGDPVTSSFRRGVETASPGAEIVIGGEILDGVEAIAGQVRDGGIPQSRPPYITLFPAQHAIDKEQQ
jgi:N-acetylglucosamine kinase-like BadF-type ATPase